MYDERSDFEQHVRDVDACLASLAALPDDPPMRDRRVLDIGGGGGMHAGLLAPRVARVWCTDIANQHVRYGGEFLRLLREKFERNGHELPLERFDFMQADAMDLPFRDGWFDLIVSFNAFEHIPDPDRVLREVARVLKPGGVAFITFDPVWTADTGSHFAHYVPEPWAHLLLDTATFRERMRAAGAADAEIAEYPDAMNRRRPAEYLRSFGARLPAALEVVSNDSWSGLVDAGHATHPNREACRTRGFGDDELELRGMRVVLRRRCGVEVPPPAPDPAAEIAETLAQWRGAVVHDSDFEALRNVPAFSRVERVMDIGANRGQSIVSLRQVLPHAEIDSFEANPRFYAGLELLQGVVGGTVRIHRFGLGHESGTLLLHVPRVGDRAYLEEASLRTDYFQKPWVAERFASRGGVTLEDVAVEIRRGDDLGFAPDLIKVDVEGAEYDVLRGLEATLRVHRPVLLVENSDWEHVTPYLATLGYSPYRYDNGRIVPFFGTSTNTYYLPDQERGGA